MDSYLRYIGVPDDSRRLYQNAVYWFKSLGLGAINGESQPATYGLGIEPIEEELRLGTPSLTVLTNYCRDWRPWSGDWFERYKDLGDEVVVKRVQLVDMVETRDINYGTLGDTKIGCIHDETWTVMPNRYGITKIRVGYGNDSMAVAAMCGSICFGREWKPVLGVGWATNGIKNFSDDDVWGDI